MAQSDFILKPSDAFPRLAYLDGTEALSNGVRPGRLTPTLIAARIRVGSRLAKYKGYPPPWNERIYPVQEADEWISNELPTTDFPFVVTALGDSNATDEPPAQFTWPHDGSLPYRYFVEQSFHAIVYAERHTWADQQLATRSFLNEILNGWAGDAFAGNLAMFTGDSEGDSGDLTAKFIAWQYDYTITLIENGVEYTSLNNDSLYGLDPLQPETLREISFILKTPEDTIILGGMDNA